MSDNTNTIVQFGELKGAADYTGAGAASTLPFTGNTRARLVKIDIEESDNGNGVFNIAQQVEDTFDGKPVSGVLYRRVLFSGKDKNGEFNAKRQLDQFLRAAGWARDRIDTLANKGETMTADALCKAIMTSGPGSTAPYVHIQVEDKEYKGKVSSDIKNYITAERYEALGGGTAKTARVVSTSPVSANGATTASADMLQALA